MSVEHLPIVVEEKIIAQFVSARWFGNLLSFWDGENNFGENKIVHFGLFIVEVLILSLRG